MIKNIVNNSQNLLRNWIIVTILLLTACAVQHPGPACFKDKIQYGQVEGAFRSRWWNFYERGRSYLEGECLDAAISDFKAAIEQNDQDQRMVRTYGLHFVDYFPHRELGLIHYLLGDLDAAKSELEKSLSQESTSKAHHYLDEVRKKQLKKKAKTVNTPSLVVHFPDKDAIWTSDERICIRGMASDEQYISNIQINGHPYDFQGAAKQIPFQTEIILSQGTYQIPIKIKNLLGGSLKKVLEIHVDHQGPLIEIVAFEKLANNILVIEGIVSDQSEMNHLYVDQKEIDLKPGIKTSFRVKHIIDADQEILVLTATDRAGNKTKAFLDIIEATQTFGNAFLASRDLIQDNVLWVQKGQNINLMLSEWEKVNIVYAEKIYLSGYISSKSPLNAFIINNQPVTINHGRLVFFNIPYKLDKGDNSIDIRIENDRNQVLKKKITFQRMVPEISQIDARLHVSMSPLKTHHTDIDKRNQFQEELFMSFVERNRFYTIPTFRRTESQLLNQSNESQIAHLTMVGQYVDSRYGVEVAVRLVDNETTQILAVKDVYSETKDKQSIFRMVDSLSIRIHNEFPLVKGTIQHIAKNVIQISLGKKQLKAQNRLIVFAPSHLNNAPEIIGFARILKIEKDTSKLVIVHMKRPISINDRVITQ
jgi:5S rRNA maturation endonuclease (ribonuclease M5)